MFEKNQKYIVIAALILLLILSFYLCLVFDVSFWFGFIFFIGILIFAFLANWIIKYVLVKYRKYKQNIDEIKQVPRRSLLDSFNLAIDYAKKYSNKNKSKQPWFIVLGSSQSGKSSLFNTADETRNSYGYCWSKENFTAAEMNGDVFLDKPSRVSVVSFEILLNSIRKAIRLNRINFKGFIVTLSIEDIEKGDEYLSVFASKIRSRLDRSFYKLGFRYPIYVVITKADKLQGFESFSLDLPDKLTNNAFGELFKEVDLFNRSGDSIVNTWIEKLRKRIRVFNTVCLQTNGSLLPRALLLEKSLKGIESNLVSFVNELLREKQEQSSKDKPFLRGMFLTSSNNSDISRSIDRGCLLETLDFDVNTRSNNKKLYVQNLINNIIPLDNTLYKPLHKKVKRKESYKRISFFSWWVSLNIGDCIFSCCIYTYVKGFQ